MKQMDNGSIPIRIYKVDGARGRDKVERRWIEVSELVEQRGLSAQESERS